MKKIEITPDLIIALGMSVALILAVALGAEHSIATGIAGALGGYMGQVIKVGDESRKKERQEDERHEGRAENH